MAKGRSEITWVTDNLAVGHAPMSYAHLEELKSQGLTAIMNLCAEFCDLHEIEEKHGFEVYYLPVHDEEAPDMVEMEKALAWLDEAVYLGKKVYIHCRHGIGRTGVVLNAYLLRRGLGHKQAGKILKSLRSKPANFRQWWTVRKYGRRSGQLKIREPHLEYKRLVELSPFFKDYKALVREAESLVEAKAPGKTRCGKGHVRCCNTPISLKIIEAVYLSHKINATFSSQDRLKAIDRAVNVAGQERLAAQTADAAAQYCLYAADATCPLLDDRYCRVFEFRPLKCRTFELPSEEAENLWSEVLQPGLDRLSQEVFFSFTSEFSPEGFPDLALPDVVSGRYVQTFFHYLSKLPG